MKCTKSGRNVDCGNLMPKLYIYIRSISTVCRHAQVYDVIYTAQHSIGVGGLLS